MFFRAFSAMIPHRFIPDRCTEDEICTKCSLFCLGFHLLYMSVVLSTERSLAVLMYRIQQKGSGRILAACLEPLSSTLVWMILSPDFKVCSTITASQLFDTSSSAAFVHTGQIREVIRNGILSPLQSPTHPNKMHLFRRFHAVSQSYVAKFRQLHSQQQAVTRCRISSVLYAILRSSYL